ncbi:MAG: NUDIX hydrolase [Candidatus Dojkabacteria bacterium]|nr:NUDIX hydrolase [Candidatus Dojkabacteria bacterium]
MPELITREDLVSQLEKYKPYDNEEIETKKIFLDFLSKYSNCFLRENELGHFSSTGVVLNKERTKILMIYHKIYDSWTWVGGHADGDMNLLYVAIKEAKEESGLEDVIPVTEEIFSIDILPVQAHVKKGVDISAHDHLNTIYVLEANEMDSLIVNETETNGVKWVPIGDVVKITNEPMMIPVYTKVIDKMGDLGIIHQA